MATKKEKTSEDAFIKMLKRELPDLDSRLISTDILALDIVLGGGYESGDMIEIASPSLAGKTTMLLYMCSMALRQGKKVAYFDVERGVKMKILNNMRIADQVSVKIGEKPMYVSRPITYRQLQEECDKVIFNEDTRHDIVIVDSIASLVPSTSMNVDENQFGLESRQQTNFLRRYKGILRGSGSTMWIINQQRTKTKKIGFSGMSVTQGAAGGNAMEHFPDIRIWMSIKTKLVQTEMTATGEEKVHYGNAVKIKSSKNRNERGEIPILAYILFGKGVSNTSTMIDILRVNGLLNTAKGKEKNKFVDIPELPCVSSVELNGEDFHTALKENYTAILEYLRDKGFLAITRGPMKDSVSSEEEVADEGDA